MPRRADLLPVDRPCGDTLIRLRDVPLKRRLDGLSRALKQAKTSREAARMLSVALNPEDAGGRIAA